MSTTDAQEETTGYKVPYLRFTKSHNPQDVWTWFREHFFGNEAWNAGRFGDHTVEKAYVDVDVSILGIGHGTRQMMVTHDPTRQDNHSTPNTWLHYDDETRGDLEGANLAGAWAVVEKDGGGGYHLLFQAAAPAWWPDPE